MSRNADLFSAPKAGLKSTPELLSANHFESATLTQPGDREFRNRVDENLVSVFVMPTTRKTSLASVGALAFLLPFAACSIDVREAQSGKNSDVDIRTPAGNLSVRTEVDVRDTGLRVYPGAWPARDRHDDESANVNIGTPWFGLKVVAAKFESNDPPDSILDFYTNEMSSYGSVTECRGDFDFRGRKGAKQPFCKEKGSSSHVALITGTEERQRIVAVKPHGDGSDFSLVYVETRGDN